MDEFFLPDDTHWWPADPRSKRLGSSLASTQLTAGPLLHTSRVRWWDQMPEPKRFVMVPNAEHSEATGILELLPNIAT